MNIAIGIVAHPSRSVMAKRLYDTVGADIISFDNNSFGERWNHTRALEELPRADWAVLLEDDAIPCPDFRVQLSNALQEAGDAIVSLYLGTGRWAGANPKTQEHVVRRLIQDADAQGSRWIEADALWHAVGIAIPYKYVESVLTYLQCSPLPTDQAITHWARQNHVPIFYTHPSLIDHADVPRIVRTQDKPVPRRAWAFGTERRA